MKFFLYLQLENILNFTKNHNNLTYYCDNQRHLVCKPYSVNNLHRMAEDLNIHRCWFHNHKKFPHYDIPKKRIVDIQSRCTVVSPQEILLITQPGNI